MDTNIKKERVMGIEPTYPAWKAGVLPLNYTRIISDTPVILSHARENCNYFLLMTSLFFTFQLMTSLYGACFASASVILAISDRSPMRITPDSLLLRK